MVCGCACRGAAFQFRLLCEHSTCLQQIDIYLATYDLKLRSWVDRPVTDLIVKNQATLRTCIVAPTVVSARLQSALTLCPRLKSFTLPREVEPSEVNLLVSRLT